MLRAPFLAPAVEDGEYAFQDAMASVSQRIGGERLAQDGEIVIFTEQRRQLVSPIHQFLLAFRPCGVEKLQLMPKILGLLAPLV